LLLALDTSTLQLSLALVSREGKVQAEIAHGPPKKQSELLPLSVQEFLAAQGTALEQLEGFLVGLGPGSFTGLRIGLATVKGFAYALNKPAAGASSLAAAALDGPEGQPLFAIGEARKGDLYLGQFVRQGTALEAFGPERALPVAEAAKLIAQTPGAIVLGPAVAQYKEALVAGGLRAEQLSDKVPFPRAANLVHLTALATAIDQPALFALEPRYVMGSGAENNPKFPAAPGPEPKARLKGE
jgi:tRNA threonylcarbamoyladenosine biosynthesis protein TsaB